MTISNKIEKYRKKYADEIDRFCNRYKMHESDLESCKLFGLWRFIRDYDQNKCRVLTHILNCIKWECLNFLKKEKKHQHLDLKEVEYCTNELDLSFLPNHLQLIVQQRFIDKRTLTEIGRLHGFSHETARKRVLQAKLLIQRQTGV